MISKIHSKFLLELSKNPSVSKIRMIGTIAAFDYHKVSNVYGSTESLLLRQKYLSNGIKLNQLETQFTLCHLIALVKSI